MSFASKTTSLQLYNMLIYRAALHPEFFGIESRRKIELDDYEFEAWVFKGGHAVRFQHNGTCVTEVVTDQPDTLPDRSLTASLPCAGEKDHESEFSDRINYVTSMQTETLTDHLYLGTYNEMLDHGQSADTIRVTWDDEMGRSNLSLLDLQRYRDEVHVQSYHLRSDCGLVLRTQSIFQIKEQPEED